MPTPFTHLQIANRLLQDDQFAARIPLHMHEGAFLLGSIAVDANSLHGVEREITHFYRYDRPMPPSVWRAMLEQHPVLNQPQDQAHRAFIAGYVGHLAVDEYWARHMLRPQFVDREWGESLRWRFFVLNLLLTMMDERDERTLTSQHAQALQTSVPYQWLPFLDDATLCEWRDFMAEQIIGESQTLQILGTRIQTEPAKLRELLDNTATMQSYLWDHLPPALLHEIEEGMYAFCREQTATFWGEVSG